MVDYSTKITNMAGNPIREIRKLIADPDIISLAGGDPAAESFPLETIRIMARP